MIDFQLDMIFLDIKSSGHDIFRQHIQCLNWICKEYKEQIAHLSWILLWFETISGLNINLEKSSVLAVRRVKNLQGLALELGCSTSTLPMTYLGLPLGMRRNSNYAWDGVEERFRKKLAIWKRQYISKGRRLTLIKSTLSNLPIYIMSLSQLPKGVKTLLEKIQTYFLWGGSYLEKKDTYG